MQIELLEIDFNSEEAIYMQLRNQIILGIATSRLQDGDTLPSAGTGRNASESVYHSGQGAMS